MLSFQMRCCYKWIHYEEKYKVYQNEQITGTHNAAGISHVRGFIGLSHFVLAFVGYKVPCILQDENAVVPKSLAQIGSCENWSCKCQRLSLKIVTESYKVCEKYVLQKGVYWAWNVIHFTTIAV